MYTKGRPFNFENGRVKVKWSFPKVSDVNQKLQNPHFYIINQTSSKHRNNSLRIFAAIPYQKKA